MMILVQILPFGLILATTSAKSCFEDGVDSFGQDLGTPTKQSSPENCQTQCSKNFACNHWTYVKSSKACWLKVARIPKASSNDIISGPRQCGGCYEYGVDYPGPGPWWGIKPSPETCQETCQSISSCGAWVYQKIDKNCYLKYTNSRKARKFRIKETVSGPKECLDFNTLREEYCTLSLDQKRIFLMKDTVSPNQVERLLASVRYVLCFLLLQ